MTNSNLYINIGGKVFRFDFSDRFGPLVLAKNGSLLERQPGPRSPFWAAIDAWVRQGKQIGDDGICIWRDDNGWLVPDGYKIVAIGGSHFVLQSTEE
jgi:hypothetical protein